MGINNGAIGFAVGAIVASAVSSTVSVFLINKFKKQDIQEEIDKITNFYDQKIKEILKEKSEKKSIQPEIKIDEIEKSFKEKNTSNPSPKIMLQDQLAKEKASFGSDDPADMNEGTAQLEVDRGIRITRNGNTNNRVDYSKMYKDYEVLAKEYEREDEKEEIKFPVQITKDDYDMTGAYRKEELIYYEQNGYFVDEVGNICDEYSENYFGINNISLFGTPKASLDGQSSIYELYLRDKDTRIDFHIEINKDDDYDKINS